MSARNTYRHWQDEKPYHLLRLSYGAVAETYNLHFLGTVRLLLIIIRQKFVIIPVGHAAVNENYARTEFWAVSTERWYPAAIHVCLDLPCGLSLREKVVSCPTSIAVNLYRRIFFPTLTTTSNPGRDIDNENATSFASRRLTERISYNDSQALLLQRKRHTLRLEFKSRYKSGPDPSPDLNEFRSETESSQSPAAWHLTSRPRQHSGCLRAPSVCPAANPLPHAGLLRWVRWAGDIDWLLHDRRSAAATCEYGQCHIVSLCMKLNRD